MKRRSQDYLNGKRSAQEQEVAQSRIQTGTETLVTHTGDASGAASPPSQFGQ